MPEYAVSACLAGVPCRYNATPAPCAMVIELVQKGQALPLCPEVLGGLPIPRIPAEIQGDCVRDVKGNEYTKEYMLGAQKALAAALEAGCKKAIVKARSPSCGYGEIYNGTFSRTLIQGNGLWTQLLLQQNFIVYTEETVPLDS